MLTVMWLSLSHISFCADGRHDDFIAGHTRRLHEDSLGSSLTRCGGAISLLMRIQPTLSICKVHSYDQCKCNYSTIHHQPNPAALALCRPCPIFVPREVATAM
jgi:hypothetical protein